MTRSIATSSVERKAVNAGWLKLSKSGRVEVFKLAKQHIGHPDAEIAATASAWARASYRRGWWGKLPPFVLPMVGVVAGVCAYVLIPDAIPRIVLVAGACGVVLFGLLGWNKRAYVRLLLALSNNPDS
ncbi:MAG: hypothetical protein ACRDRL_13885 [Sciscionella sp.]